MKKALNKILCIFLIFLLLFNFICPKSLYAANEEEEESGNSVADTIWNIGGGLVDGVTGILLMPAKVIVITVGTIARAVASQIAEVDATGDESVWFLSLEDIFFHNANDKLPILNINFFKSTSGAYSSSHPVISGIRNNIAGWYYAIRNLAIIISLLVLLYIGIRMAISTLADDKAKYKEMFKDWLVGFITIFLLHYIIIATININEALVKALNPPQTPGGQTYFSDYMDQIVELSMGTISFTQGMGAAIVYTFMTILVFMYLFTYIKRMLTVAFLIIIAPVITVTYSIDKLGDRKISSVKYMVKGIYI